MASYCGSYGNTILDIAQAADIRWRRKSQNLMGQVRLNRAIIDVDSLTFTRLLARNQKPLGHRTRIRALRGWGFFVCRNTSLQFGRRNDDASDERTAVLNDDAAALASRAS